MSNIFEITGLDWFPYAIGLKNVPIDETVMRLKLGDVREKFAKLNDKEKINDALAYSLDQFDQEENRRETVEAKAFTMLSITGIATAFILGITGLFPDEKLSFHLGILILISLIYISVVFALVMTILLAFQTVVVGRYHFSYPDINDLEDLLEESLIEVKKERFSSIFFSYLKNSEVINQKATYLIGSQLWFRNSVVLLAVLALLLAIIIPLAPSQEPTPIAPQVTLLPTTIPSIVISPSTETPAVPSAPKPTSTSSPNISPTSTVVKPTVETIPATP